MPYLQRDNSKLALKYIVFEQRGGGGGGEDYCKVYEILLYYTVQGLIAWQRSTGPN